MRHLVVVGVLLVSTIANADPKAIETAVKTNLVEIAKLSDNDKLAITKDAILITNRGMEVDLKARDGCVAGAVADAFYGCMKGSITHAPGAVKSGTSGDVGWFQAPFVQTITAAPDGKPVKASFRAGGIVLKDGTDWKIAAALYVATMSDKELFKTTLVDLPRKRPMLTGNKKVAELVQAWFVTGFAERASKTGTLLASGTSPSEYKIGAAAKKLVESWDRLRIQPHSIDVTMLAGGKVGWVTAVVRLPRKTDQGITMRFAAVIVPDGESDWTWVSLMYQPPSDADQD